MSMVEAAAGAARPPWWKAIKMQHVSTVVYNMWIHSRYNIVAHYIES